MFLRSKTLKTPKSIIAKIKPIFILELICDESPKDNVVMVAKAVMVIFNVEETWEKAVKMMHK